MGWSFVFNKIWNFWRNHYAFKRLFKKWNGLNRIFYMVSFWTPVLISIWRINMNNSWTVQVFMSLMIQSEDTTIKVLFWQVAPPHSLQKLRYLIAEFPYLVGTRKMPIFIYNIYFISWFICAPPRKSFHNIYLMIKIFLKDTDNHAGRALYDNVHCWVITCSAKCL